MAANGGFGFEFDFDLDQAGSLPAGSFSRLLLSDDGVSPFSFPASPTTSLFSMDTPKMLCFGDFSEEDDHPSSPISKSPSNASISSLSNASNSNKKRNSTPPPEKESSDDVSGAGPPKKSRSMASGAGHAKVKKREKIGDRIATLQQLVSPYGKTDTASVLHETMGYIRFLQEQVKVLCSPYLQGLPSSSSSCFPTSQDLKSKGLCLIPVSSIADVASRNGADLWSPVTVRTVSSHNAASSATATATATATSLMC